MPAPGLAGPASDASGNAASTPALAARARALARAYAALSGVTTCLIVLGALVRANGAGLACPDWPLCFGEAIPRFDVKIGFEVGHRYLAGLMSLGFVTLAVVVLRDPRLRAPLLPGLGLGAVLLALQILLGALTVWHLLASWTVTSHLLCGNAVNLSLLVLWRRSSELAEGEPLRMPLGAGLRALIGVVALLLVVQMVLGGLVSSRFASLACDEWPTCSGGEWFPGFHGARAIHLLHRLGAYALVGLLAVAAPAARGHGRLARLMAAAALVAVLQATVGIANVLLRVPVEVTGLHSFLAACLVGLVGLATREAWLAPRRARPGAAL